jgi:predicted permease
MLKQILITIRRLGSRPAFTLAAVATLAVGIGATTAIFSTVNATLLRPLPYPNPGDIYAFNTQLIDGRYTTGWDRLGGAHVAAAGEAASVSHAIAYAPGTITVLLPDGTPRDVPINRVTEGFFELFGLPMAQGRAFVDEDYVPGATVAVISDRLWAEMYGRDLSAVDGPLQVRGMSFTIVGIAPPEFDVAPGTDVWIPFSLPAGMSISYQGYLRVEPGTTREVLESELAAAMPPVVEEYPFSTGRVYVLRPLVESIVGDLGPILVIVLGGAIVLLLLGCVNVATLILGRGAAQTREMALLAALGGTRGRILARFFTEGAVLAAAGTLLGVLLAWVGVKLLFTFAGADLPRLDEIPFDLRVLGFALAIMVVATLVIGLLPALRLSTPDIRGLLSEGGRSASASRGSRRLLGGLVVAEIALAITLVAGAGWLVRSYTDLAERDLGFTPAGRLLVEAKLPDDQATIQNYFTQVPERLAALGQVSAIGSGSSLPLRPFLDAGFYIGVPGEPYDANRQDVGLRSSASPDLFDALGVRVLAGRALTEEDFPPPPRIEVDPVTGMQRAIFDAPQEIQRVVVNQGFADRYFPNRDPIGETFAWGAPLVNFNSLLQIVGVVESVQYRNLKDPVRPIFYAPTNISPTRMVIATTLDDPTELIPTIRATLSEVDPSVDVEIQPLSDLVSVALAPYRLGLILMVLFGVISLGLAAIGIFGVVAHTTSERTRELATRAALGTTPAGVVGLLLKQARSLAVLGIVFGAAAAVLGGRVVASMVFEVPARDPLILIVAAGAVLSITLLAYLLPALRASRISPAEALKAD